MRKISYLVLMLLCACATQKRAAVSPVPAIIHGKMYTTFFQQRASEYKALCFQAFNIAKLRVDEWKPTGLKPAIVTDIDETVLDNSPYAAKRTLLGLDYDQRSWEEWTGLGQADTVPGSYAFLTYAASKGIEIFYITNRNESERAGTLKNLQRYNFPNADNDHIIMRQTTASKETRRQALQKTHSIVLLMGDNLADFSMMFDRKQAAPRDENTRQLSAEFGNRFIVLPNTTYGDWEGASFNYNSSLTPAQKDSIIRSVLKAY